MDHVRIENHSKPSLRSGIFQLPAFDDQRVPPANLTLAEQNHRFEQANQIYQWAMASQTLKSPASIVASKKTYYSNIKTSIVDFPIYSGFSDRFSHQTLHFLPKHPPGSPWQ